MNGNGAQAAVLKHIFSLLIPLLALAVAWGTIQTRLDNLHVSVNKIELNIKEIESVLLHLQLEQRESQMFRRQWLIRWGHYLEGRSNE
tara:strand:- start:5569 stop:5832 length:264 start_codon:yes stop_codon:yes gene_type:complete